MERKIVKNFVVELKTKLKPLCSDEIILYHCFNRVLSDNYIEMNNLFEVKDYLSQKIPNLFSKKIDSIVNNLLDICIPKVIFEDIKIFDLCFQYYNFDKNDYLKKTQFYTPKHITQNICNKYITKDMKNFLEPACGSGAFLREIYNSCSKFGNKSFVIDAFEIDERAIQLAQISYTINAFQKNGELVFQKINNKDFVFENITKKYDCIISNPPFLGRKLMPKKYMGYFKNNFGYAKENVSYGFLAKSLTLLKQNAITVFVMPDNFLYLINTKDFKNFLKTNYTVNSVTPLSTKDFADILGSNLSPCILSVQNKLPNKKKDTFNKKTTLFDVVTVVTGIQTGNNKKYVKHFKELQKKDMAKTISQKNKKWYPYLKGGGYKKWSGNDEYYVYFENNGEKLRKEKGSIIRNEKYFDKNGITYSYYAENRFSARYKDKGTLFDIGGSCLFFDNDEDLYYILALLNSNVGTQILNNINPTMSYQTSSLKQLPVIFKNKQKIAALSKKAVLISKKMDKFFANSKYFLTPDFIKNNSHSFEKEFLKSIEKYFNLYEILNDIEKEINNNFEAVYKMKVEKFYSKKEKSKKQIEKMMIETFFEWLNVKNPQEIIGYMTKTYPNSFKSDILFIAKILNGKYFNNPQKVFQKTLNKINY